MKVRKGMENFYKAMCEWNAKKSMATYKELLNAYANDNGCGVWRNTYYIIKNTLSGKFKKLEKEFTL